MTKITLPKITIITAVLNEVDALKDTLKSIQAQAYPNLEYIVIDGGSTDGTVAWLQQQPQGLLRWQSGQDQNIADAFNKGLALATGDYINFQGAGDTLASPEAFSKLMAGLPPNHYDLICGQVTRVTSDGQTPLWVAPKKVKMPFQKRSLLWRLSLPHQALLTHRRFFEKFGMFDLNAKFAMDYELLLRAYHDFPPTMVRPVMVAHWRAGGIGENRIMQIYDEYHRIKQQHQLTHPMVLQAINRFIRMKWQIKNFIKVGSDV